jgi:hypothetical protein
MPWLHRLPAHPDTVQWPRRADEGTWRRIFAEGMVPQFVVPQFGFGSIPAPDGAPGAGEAYMPVVMLGIAPGQFDFADPETGFHGWTDAHPGRVLELWADDMLTIRHGSTWRIVLDGVEPFDRWWVDSLFPAAGARFTPTAAAALVQFTGIEEGQYPREQLDMLPLTVVNIADRRTG